MCGLAGYANVTSASVRYSLTLSLGLGVDSRGGHAAGYVAVLGGRVNYARKAGYWADASARFLRGAAGGEIAIIHARYATCGDKDAPQQAHPFAIKRPIVLAGTPGQTDVTRTVLWGAHNGMLQGTHASAAKHGRKHDVDSRELFELLADGDLESIRELEGYGVLAWVTRGADEQARTVPPVVRLVRMTDESDLVIGATECGAAVWASTLGILDEALEDAGLKLKHTFRIVTGQVYEVHADGRVLLSAHPNITVSSWNRPAKHTGYRLVRSWSAENTAWADGTDNFDTHDPGAGDPTAEDWERCPYCKGVDTWVDGNEGFCATCDLTWADGTDDFDTHDPGAGDPTAEGWDDEEEQAWDGEAWSRWLESERRRARGVGLPGKGDK